MKTPQESMPRHVEVPVKVTAWVDRGIASLVGAINLIPGVETIESCEGTATSLAFVQFCHHRTSKTLSVAAAMASALADTVGESAYRIRIEWGYGGKQPLALLEVERSSLSAVEAAIRRFATHCRKALETKP